MSIRIEGVTAYVDTAKEALEIADKRPDLKDVVISDRSEHIKLVKLMKGFGIK